MWRVPFGFLLFGVEPQDHVEHFFAAATEQRQCAMRGNGRQRFRIIEIVGKFLAGILFAFHHFRFHHRVVRQVFAQRLQQRGIFGEALHQYLACAVECCLGIGHAGVVALFRGEGRFDEACGFLFRVERGIGQQGVGQFVEACFRRNLCLGPALDLVRQVQVFEAHFVFGMQDLVEQGRCHFALLLDGGDDGGASVFQFAQVAQALFEQA